MQAPAVPTITAQTARVTRRDLVELLLVRGTITTVPNEDVKLSALVAGRVVALAVAEGDPVRKGQVVAEIDPRPFQDQRRHAAAAVDQAVAADGPLRASTPPWSCPAASIPRWSSRASPSSHTRATSRPG